MKSKKFFCWGILAAFGALVTEIIFSIIFPSQSVKITSVSAIFVFSILAEEFFKLVFIGKSLEIQGRRTKAVLFGSLGIGTGFSATEAVFIIASHNSVSLSLLSGVISVMIIHVITATVFGILFSLFEKTRIVSLFSLLSAFTIHFIYNLLVIRESSFFMIYAYLSLIGGILALSAKLAPSKNSNEKYLPNNRSSIIMKSDINN